MITRPPRRWLAATALVVIVIATAAGPATAAAGRGSDSSLWDPRLEPIAKQVEELRDLDFERPVKVRFLSDAQFEKSQRADRSKLSKDDEEDLQRTQAQLRALGLISSEVDLFESSNDIRASDVLAYYDPSSKRVTVKGKGKLDVATRVVLAHELTHALQDQHFDLKRISRVGSRHHASGATRALVEGDASRIESLYRQGLSSDDQAAALADQQVQVDESQANAEEQQVPSLLLALFQAPYALGPAMVQVADAGKDGGIDALFEVPPTHDAAFVTPSTVVDDAKFHDVAKPALADGEKRVGKADVFGAFALYLVLGARLGPADALNTADRWGGDSMVSFERGGQTCLRATIVGHDAVDTTVIGDRLQTWADAGPPGSVELDRSRGRIGLTVCDTGAELPAPAHDGNELLGYLALRNTVYAGILGQGASSKTARCTADGVMDEPLIAPLLEHPDEAPSSEDLAALRSKVSSITRACAR